MPEHDPWAGTSGLRDDYDGTITSMRFVYDSEYNNGNTLIARVEVDVDGEDEPEILKLSTGSGWEDDKKGTAAKREDGSAPKGFNKSCNLGRFIAGALETEFAPIARATVPWDATVWDGQKFHFNRIAFPNFDPKKDPTDVTIPQAYLGASNGAAPAAEKKADPKAKAAAAKAAAAKAKAAAATGGDDAGLVVLAALAGECATHDEFIEKAYAALDDPDAYEDKIVDDSFYIENHG